MQTDAFDPQPLLQLMAEAIIQDYGRRTAVRLAEHAIAKLRLPEEAEARDIWLGVHAALQTGQKSLCKSSILH